MNRTELKALAKEQIKGKIGKLFVINFIIVLVSFGASFICSLIPFVGSILPSVFVSAPFALSMIMIYLTIASGNDINVSDAFSGYNNFWGAFKVNFLVGLFTALWSLLFVIPGIVKSYSYSMAMYILAENPEMGALDAITKSRKMTDGHKMELFVLGLSFIGWSILVAVTFGIAAIWVVPYAQTTYANFYKKLKEEFEPAPAPVEASFTEKEK